MMIMNRCFLLLFFLVLLIGNVYAITINEITITPDLDISYFGRYQIDANITEYSVNDVNLLVSAINGDGGTCWDYFVDGTCSSETPSTYSLDYNETTDFWHYDRVYPDTIYPEIIFIDSPTNWNNAPSWVNLWRQNYHIFKMYNSFEMDSNMNLWIEFNTEPNNASNSGDLLVYVVASGVPLTYFTSDWRNQANTQLVGTISRNTAFNHDHTPSTHYVRHHLIPITSNPDGTIGTNNIDISDGNFYIVLYQDSPQSNRGWKLAYKTTALCNNSDNWFTAGRTGGTWTTPTRVSGCPDAHIHFARRENIVDGVNIEIIAKEGETTTTESQSFYFAELPNLAPNQTSFITPMIGATYDTNNILISWNQATDPNNDPITYDINYMDSEGNVFVIASGLTDSNFDWNVLEIPDGNYDILGRICDDEPLCTDFNLGGYFTIERIDPIYSLTNISITSNYSNPIYAKTDNNITLNFMSTGILNDLNIFFYSGGEEINNSVLISNTDTNYTATYLISSEDLEGGVSFTINASNLDYEYTDTTDNTSVTVDNNSPTTTLSGNSEDWTNTNQTITLSCSDTTSDCNVTQYRIDDGEWQNYSTPFEITTDGNHQIDYNSTDAADNTEETKTAYTAIDKHSPTIEETEISGFVINDSNIAGTGTITSGVCSDNNSGIDTNSCEYTVDGGNTWNSANWNSDENKCYKEDITIISNRTYIFNMRIKDNVNNLATGTATREYTSDNTKPSYTSITNENIWKNEDFNLIINGITYGLSDKNSAEYRIDDDEWQELNDQNSIEITEEGIHNIDLNFVDNLGNYLEVMDVVAKLDKTEPTTTISGNSSDWINSNQTITLSCSDTTSDCNITEYRINNESWNNYSVAFIISEDRNNQIDYKSTDAAENTEEIKTAYAAIDKTPPVITLTDINADVITNNQIIDMHSPEFTFQFSAEDSNSGVKAYYVREGTGVFNLTTDENYTITASGPNTVVRFSVLVQDNALNQDVISATIYFCVEDEDEDGVSDFEDTFIGSLDIVDTEGVDDLNITIDDDTNLSGSFDGLQTIKIYDDTNPIAEFDHNFSESTLDLSLIKIIKTSRGIVVDLNGQLQEDQNKILYLGNNNFISLCVENAPITSISDISSACSGENEFDFTTCLDGNYSVNGIDCIYDGTTITVSNLEYSGILGTLRSSSGGTSISSDTDDTEENITEDLKDSNNSNNSENLEEIAVVTSEDKKPEDNLVSSDRPDYNPDGDKTTIDYSKKSKNATTIWIITYLICAIIIAITIYIFTKIRYR